MQKFLKMFLVTGIVFMMAFTVIPVNFAGNQVSAASDNVVKTKTYSKSAGKYSLKAKQAKLGGRTMNVYLPKIKSLKKAKVSKVKFTARMYSGKSVTASKSRTVKISKISSKKKMVSMSLPALGKYNVEAKFYNKKGKKIKTVILKNTGLIAKEYNIAVVNGSYGPLLLSLSLWDVTKNDKGEAIPTALAYSRPGSYDWNSMPPNVYSNPKAKSPKTGNLAYKLDRMSAYVADLHSLNRSSKFHFYFADNYVSGILELACGNGIKESNYDVTLLSDGSGTAAYFNGVYGKSNASRVYDTMSAEWNVIKKAYSEGHRISTNSLKYHNYGLARYAYVAVNESSNVKWWVGSAAAFASEDTDFLNAAKSKMEVKNLNNMLEALKANGNEAGFKKWCHFDDSMFAEASKNHKKVMVLMGSRVTRETDFEEFTKFVKNYYGDGYEYYYKGHPGTPTKLYPEKQQQLKNAGVHDVDSSIPAELILYFYPDVYCSGMSNSTLNSSYKDGRTCAYFGARKAAALKKNEEGATAVIAAEKFQMFFTKIDATYDGELEYNKDHKCYLVEFNGNDKYDYAIYDYNDDKITYHEIKSSDTVKASESKAAAAETSSDAEDAGNGEQAAE